MTAQIPAADLLAYNFNLGNIDGAAWFRQAAADPLPGRSLLHDLAREGDVLSIEALVDQGCDGDAVDARGRTPLHEAAEAGSTPVTAFLLDNCARINAAVPPFGHTPLYLACLNGHLPVVQLLLACGADTGVTDNMSGQGLLHVAAAKGDIRLVGLLIAAGADVFAADLKGRLPRDYAAGQNRADVERALLKVMEHRAHAT